MNSRRARSVSKSRLKSKSASAASQRTPFGEVPLLAGEDAAAYEQLRNQVNAVVKPVDIIEKIFIDDFVSLQWEVLRWRRVKSSLVQARAIRALEEYLYYIFRNGIQNSKMFVETLTDFLMIKLPREQAQKAPMLAYRYSKNDPDAVDAVTKFLAGIGSSIHEVERLAQAGKVIETVQAYVRREPGTVGLIDWHLTGAGESMQGFVADAHIEKLADIERIDRLIAIAESRRNASLREIDRRQAILGETMRRAVHEIEENDLKVIGASPAKKKNAA